MTKKAAPMPQTESAERFIADQEIRRQRWQDPAQRCRSTTPRPFGANRSLLTDDEFECADDPTHDS
jgi:hypothetical protein